MSSEETTPEAAAVFLQRKVFVNHALVLMGHICMEGEVVLCKTIN